MRRTGERIKWLRNKSSAPLVGCRAAVSQQRALMAQEEEEEEK